MAKDLADDGSSSEFEEDLSLLHQERIVEIRYRNTFSWIILDLFLASGYVIGIGTIFLLNGSLFCRDPSLPIWSPAKDAVKYKTVTSVGYFFNRSPYLGTHVDKLDSMWKDLYDFGTSAISPTEASKLPNATLPTPKDNSTYLVELGVFHHLHCLNIIRKAAYPDQYPEMWVYHGNGTVNHNALPSFHLDHCIDSLRQHLMCTANVTRYSFHYNLNDFYHPFPQIWATGTCRDFDKIKNWAIGNQVERWKLDLDIDTKLKSPPVQ